jgi:hypothetical protein
MVNAAGEVISPGPDRGGRPSAYTEEVAEAVCQNIADGNTIELAAKAGGVSGSTVRRWARENRGADADGSGGFRPMLARALEQRYALGLDMVHECAVKVMAGKMPPDRGKAVAYILEKQAQLLRPRSNSVAASEFSFLGGGGDGASEPEQTGVLVIESPARSYEEACARVGQRPAYIDRDADGLAG